MRRGDKILGVLLVLFLLGYIGMRQFYTPDSAQFVTVTQSDGVIHRFSLAEDRTFEVTGADGAYNQIVIEDGRAYMARANCSDKSCVNSGAISSPGRAIVCLPHRVILECEGKSPDFDAVTS